MRMCICVYVQSPISRGESQKYYVKAGQAFNQQGFKGPLMPNSKGGTQSEQVSSHACYTCGSIYWTGSLTDRMISHLVSGKPAIQCGCSHGRLQRFHKPTSNNCVASRVEIKDSALRSQNVFRDSVAALWQQLNNLHVTNLHCYLLRDKCARISLARLVSKR